MSPQPDPTETRSPRPEVTVMVCHDCCCGTTSKHPRVDHAAQREALFACASERVRVREVDCLDECDRSNVVLVRDHTKPRKERDTWLGNVLSDGAVDRIAAWVSDGGDMPAGLTGRLFRRRAPAPK